MISEINIRPIIQSDVDGLALLYDRAVTDNEMDSISGASSKPFFQACASSIPIKINGFESRTTIDVALERDAIIGFAATKFKQSNEWRGVAYGKKLTELWLLVVSSHNRDKKVGTQLLDFQIQTALAMASTCDSPRLIVRCEPGKKRIAGMLADRGFKSVVSPDGKDGLFFEREI